MENSAAYLTFFDTLKLLGGTSVVLIGLIAFVGKITISRTLNKEKASLEGELSRLEASLSAKINALESKNESRVHVHKMQFEKEFTEYQVLWQKAVILDTELRSLRSKSEYHRLYEPALQKYYDCFSDLKDFNLNSHPFYFRDVYDASTSLILLAQSFHDNLQTHEDYLSSIGSDLEHHFEKYDKGVFLDKLKDHEIALGKCMRGLSGKIRSRWESMVLIENDL